MNSETPSEPTIQPSVSGQPPAVDSKPKPKRNLLAILFGSALFIINLTAFGFIGFFGFLLIELSLHPSPVSIVAIVLEPMLGVALIVVTLIDGIYSLLYLRHKDKTKKKSWAAIAGLVVCVIIFSLVVIDFLVNIIGIYQIDHPDNSQDSTAAQTNMERAASNGYGFDIVAANYVPNGYKWNHGEIYEDNSVDDIYSDVQYHKPISGIDYSIDIVTFSKRGTFQPPSNCSYYLEPYARTPWDKDRIFTCPLVATTTAGHPIYHYEGPLENCECKAGDPTGEAYYMEDGRNEVIMSFIKDPNEPNETEALQIMNSLTIISVESLVKNNIDSKRFEL